MHEQGQPNMHALARASAIDPQALIAAIEAHSEAEPNSACLLWVGSLTDLGYGVFGSARTRYGIPERVVHRIVWHLAHGPIAPGRKVLHRCDVRSCINIGHLFEGTQADNVADMVAKGRQRTVPRYGEDSHLARLTRVAVTAIRADFASGISQRALAKRHGVCVMTINRAIRGESWPVAYVG